jgi:hypothetical protein
MRKFLFFLFVFIFLFPQRTHAIEFVTDETARVDHPVSGTLLITGSSVRIDAPVDGDVFCAGRDIIISAPVHGDVLCAGQSLMLRSVVDGSVRLAGQNVHMSGTVTGNGAVFGQTVTVAQEAILKRDFLFAGQLVQMDGAVKRDMSGVAQRLQVNGNVGHDVIVELDQLTVSKTASIGGALSYTSDSDGDIDQHASIAGTVKRVEEKSKEKDSVKKSNELFRPFTKTSWPWLFGYHPCVWRSSCFLCFLVFDDTYSLDAIKSRHYVCSWDGYSLFCSDSFSRSRHYDHRYSLCTVSFTSACCFIYCGAHFSNNCYWSLGGS